MKTAILLYGNIRTFLMPLRKNPQIKLCDILIKDLINKTEADVFISTDSEDFYYDGFQYWNNEKEIQVTHPNNFRFYKNIKLESHENCSNIIKEELNKLPLNIKSINIVNEKKDYANNDNFKIVKESKHRGSIPELLFSQYKKIYNCYKMMEDYEIKNNFQYDIVFKTRFDCTYQCKKDFNLESLDYENCIYVPNIEPAVVYDSYALSKRKNILEYLKLYENLGFTINKPAYGFNNKCCGRNIIYDKIPEDIKNLPGYNTVEFCMNCKKPFPTNYFDLTISSEYHIHEILKKNNINVKVSAEAGFTGEIYRYLDETDNYLLNNIINDNDIKKIKIFGNVN
jgi:hypothetical protein